MQSIFFIPNFHFVENLLSFFNWEFLYYIINSILIQKFKHHTCNLHTLNGVPKQKKCIKGLCCNTKLKLINDHDKKISHEITPSQ